MNLYLIIFNNKPFKKEAIYKEHQAFFTEVEKYFTLYLVPLEDINKIPSEEYKMAFIASSHVENIVTQYFEDLPYPIHLVTDGENNALSATLEVSAWIRNKGMKVHLIHGTIPSMIKQILDHHHVFAARRSIKGKRIGVIGFPSPWIIASNVDYLMAKRRWGIEFINIQPEEAMFLYYQISEDEIGPLAEKFIRKAAACKDGEPEDLINAIRLYKALKILAEKKQLNALTFTSAPFIDKIGVVGNVAASMLNDDGIPTTCEGDLQSIVTMMVAKILTGQPGFMGNISFINDKDNSFVISHSSIPTSMTKEYIIRNETEMEAGMGIQGLVDRERITLFKCGGECLDEYFTSLGTIIENTEYPIIGRTQFRIKMDKNVNYFYTGPIGNHHIILLGEHQQVIKEFMQLYSCKSVY